MQILGREHLPAQGPFVIIANHASHLDALILTAALPLRWRDRTFPIAARDVFFERRSVAAFSAMVINAMPVFRRATGRHDLAEMRERLRSQSCIYILFPEGTRTRDGAMNHFKAGIGMLVAGTSIPVVPSHIEGSFSAMSPNRWFLRPTPLKIRIGPPHVFADISNSRDGWHTCADQLERAVLRLEGEANLGL
jgi:1-acyl-sn-glycerol-3-phosphate acyltransferase